MTHTFTNANPAAVGQATKLSDLDKVYENTFNLNDRVTVFDNGGVRTLNAQFTPVGNVGGGLDDLMSYTLPANTLATDGRGVRITAWGTAPSTAGTKNLYLLFGSITLVTGLIAASDGVRDWKIIATVMRSGATAQISGCVLSFNPGGTTTGSVEDTNGTETLSSAVVIKAQAQGTSNNDVVQNGMLVELF